MYDSPKVHSYSPLRCLTTTTTGRSMQVKTSILLHTIIRNKPLVLWVSNVYFGSRCYKKINRAAYFDGYRKATRLQMNDLTGCVCLWQYISRDIT